MTQVVVDGDLMEYELPSTHGMWNPPKKETKESKNRPSYFIHESPPRPTSSSSLFVMKNVPSVLAQPVEPFEDSFFGCN